MIVAVRLDGRGRCSFDCICVCVNTLLLVARPAWHVTFRRHCCRLDRKARKSRSHRRAGQDQSTRTSGRSQDETKVGSLWQDHEFRITVPSSRYQRRQAESNTRHALHQPQTECAMPIPSATCRIEDGRRICTCCFEPFSMQINAGWGRWGDTNEAECKSPVSVY